MIMYKYKILDINELNKFDALDVYIYGAGSAGKNLKQLIEKAYPHLSVKCFIDTYKSGLYEGKQIIRIDDYQHQSENVIFVASYAKKQICETLTSRGIGNFYIVEEFWTFQFMFSADEIREKMKDVDKICSFLSSAMDKALYQFLFAARSHGSTLSRLKYLEEPETTVLAFNDPDAFKKKFKTHTNKQYLDFIAAEPVEIVVQAGVYDGSDIAEVNCLAPNLKKVYGFEPLGKDHLLDEIHALVDQGKVVIESTALYDKKATVNFFPYQAGSYISDDMVPTERTYKVETTSLDDYCRENKIDRVDLIFCDIENAEIGFLLGAKSIIRQSRPQLAISMYHSKEQFIEIPLLLHSMLDDYIFKIGHYSDTLNETTLYAIPVELT